MIRKILLGAAVLGSAAVLCSSGRLALPFEPAYKVKTYSYDAQGELTDKSAEVYDAFDRLLSKKEKDVSTGDRSSFRYRYDQTEEGVVKYNYYDGDLNSVTLLDPEGKPLREEVSYSDSVIVYSYDEHGSLLSVKGSPGSEDSVPYGEYEYDEDGKLLTGKLCYHEDDPDYCDLTVYSYDDSGRLATEHWYSADKVTVDGEEISEHEFLVTFNENEDPVSELHTYYRPDVGQIGTLEFKFRYNGHGHRILQETYNNGELSNRYVSEYTYY